MSDKTVSRRDWFRLRAPAENRMLSKASTGSPSPINTFQEVTQPPNHSGLDLSKLPPLSEAELDWDEVHQLIDDIRNLTDEITLMRSAEKTASRAHAREQLLAAAAALQSGQVNRIQIRYRWDGAQWIDTLERRGESFRLVRIRHEFF